MLVNVSFIFYTTQFDKAVYTMKIFNFMIDVYFGNCSHVTAANESCYYHEAFKKCLRYIISIVNKVDTAMVLAVFYFSCN